MQTKIIVTVILILGFLLRVINISNNPLSLYGDELTIVQDAYSLYKTGSDQLGNRFPLTFQMGAGRPAGYVYASIPIVAFFGPTALAVRMLSILSGLGIIALIYLLGKRLFSQKVGLCAAFIAAVSPWDIALSRGGFEAHFALFLVLLGTYFFIKAKENTLFYLISALSFGLTLHTYPTYKISLVLFLPLLLWYQGGAGKKHFFAGMVVFFLLGILAFSQTFIGGSEVRFSAINVFSQEKLKEEILQKINFERTISSLPANLVPYFHNKPVEYAKVLIGNYLQNFSMDFLILHGDRNPRHNMATMGEIYFVEIIFIFIGLLTLWQKNRKIFVFIVSWLVLAPIPTAIVDLPHALRSSFMLPPLVIISAIGLNFLINKKMQIILAVLFFVFIIQFAFFIQKLYFLAPSEYSNFWSYSAKVASGLAMQGQSKYKYIFLSDAIDSIEFAYPVYSKVDPAQVILQNKDNIKIGNYKFKKFDNVYIGHIPKGDINQFVENLDGTVLFIGNPDLKDAIRNYETILDQKGLSILAIKKVYK